MLLEHGDPAIERREIGPFEVMAIDGVRRCHQHPPHVAAGDEPIVSAVEQLFCALRIAVQQRNAQIQGKPGLALLCLGAVLWLKLDPSHDIFEHEKAAAPLVVAIEPAR